jgi:hypothetical protein
MTFKGIRYIIIFLFAITIVSGVISPLLSDFQHTTANNNELAADKEVRISKLDIGFKILQTNTTTTENTTEETTTTEDDDFNAWKPFIGEGLYYPLALLFSFLGIFSTGWLIFFVETSKERTIRDRIIGTTIRLIVMGIFVGLAIHFWVLFEPL